MFWYVNWYEVVLASVYQQYSAGLLFHLGNLPYRVVVLFHFLSCLVEEHQNLNMILTIVSRIAFFELLVFPLKFEEEW